MIEFIKKRFRKEGTISITRKNNTYGRCVRLSLGLVIGLIIDKTLFYISKGLSVFIPPFSMILMKRGKVLKEIRFDKDFGFFDKLIDHICWRN